MEVTIKLLENAMKTELENRTTGEGWTNGCGRFLIDGFPRKLDQAEKFEEDVSLLQLPSLFAFTFYHCRYASRL